MGQQSDYSEKAGRCVAVRLAERLAEHMGYLVWSRLPISTSGGQSWMILLKKLVATALAAKRLLPTSSSSCCFMKLALRSMEKTSHGFRRWIQWIVLPYSDRLLLQVAGNLQNGPHFSLFYHPSAPSSVCHILSPRTCGLRQRHSVHEWGVSGLPAKKITLSTHLRQWVGHPASNCIAERYVQYFKHQINKMDSDPGFLNDKISRMLLAYRSTP